eukprot:g18707.t1
MMVFAITCWPRLSFISAVSFPTIPRIGLAVPARSGEQSRSTLLDAPLDGDDSVLGRVVERAVEDSEWLSVARVLLSVGASGTATCNGRPLYLFVQEQAERKTRGFNELLAPLLARIGQDIDQWKQPTALVEDERRERMTAVCDVRSIS